MINGLCYHCWFETNYISGWYIMFSPHTNKTSLYHNCYFKVGTYLRLGFPGGAVVKNPHANARDASSVPGSGRSPGDGNGNWLQYSCLENPMDRGAWWATVHRVAKSWMWLSNWPCTHLRWLQLSCLSKIYFSPDSFPCSPTQWQLLASAGPNPAKELPFFFFQTDFQVCFFFFK